MVAIANLDGSLVDDLILANRILFAQSIVDGFGHVSVRVSQDRFLIARSVAPALVTADDLQVLDLEGRVLSGSPQRSYLERFIHCEIYRHRSDVKSIVHSHSPSVIPFGVVRSVRLRPICHMSGFLAPATPVFEIREGAGSATDMLITDQMKGQALAKSLASHAAVLMRGHGVTVVGETLRQAVFRSVYTETNARLQAQAMQLGEINFMTDEESARSAAVNDGQIDRAWHLWAINVRPKRWLHNFGR